MQLYYGRIIADPEDCRAIPEHMIMSMLDSIHHMEVHLENALQVFVLLSSNRSVLSLSSVVFILCPQRKKAPGGFYHWRSDLEKHASIVEIFRDKIKDFQLEETRAFDAAKRELDSAAHAHDMAKRREIARGKAAAIAANAAAFGSGSGSGSAADANAVRVEQADWDLADKILHQSPSPRGNRTPRDEDDPYKDCTHNEPDS